MKKANVSLEVVLLLSFIVVTSIVVLNTFNNTKSNLTKLSGVHSRTINNDASSVQDKDYVEKVTGQTSGSLMAGTSVPVSESDEYNSDQIAKVRVAETAGETKGINKVTETAGPSLSIGGGTTVATTASATPARPTETSGRNASVVGPLSGTTVKPPAGITIRH